MAGPAGNSAPHSGQTVSDAWAFAPHFGHVLSISTAAGLKHIHNPFSLQRCRAIDPPPSNPIRYAKPTVNHRANPTRMRKRDKATSETILEPERKAPPIIRAKTLLKEAPEHIPPYLLNSSITVVPIG